MLFFLACLYVGLYYIRPFEWVPFLMGKPVFLILSVSCFVVLLISWGSGRIQLFRYKTDIMVLGFTLAIALSHLSHGYFGGANVSLQKFFPVFVGYFLITYALNTPPKINIFIMLLIGLTSFIAYESYLQVVNGVCHGGLEPLLQRVGFNEDGSPIYLTRTRWYGVFNDPNDLGMLLMFLIPVLIERIYQRRWVLSFFVLPLILYGVYSTNSRGAMLALLFGTFAYLVLRYKSILGVSTGLAFAFIGMLFGPSRMSSMSGEGESAYGRIEAWYQGFQMFKSNPIFGVGMNTFSDYHSLTAHNSYVLVLAELGFFGSIFFAGVFVFPLLWVKSQLIIPEQGSVMNTEDRGLASAFIGGLIGVMSAMFFLSRSYILLPFLMVGILNAFAGVKEREQHVGVLLIQNSTLNWKLLTVVVILEILFINVLVKLFL